MRILFIHRNLPGQFRHLAPFLGADPANTVVFIGERLAPPLAGVAASHYRPHRVVSSQAHHYLQRAESSVLRGQAVARLCQAHARRGFVPDVVVAHPGWGESLFLREVLPKTRILAYCELLYRADGADVGYLPEISLDLDGKCRLRIWNADLLVSLEQMDAGLSPTEWQRQLHPPAFQPQIRVIHEGVDCAEVRPGPGASFAVPGGPLLAAGDEVVTYVARNLEPYRGFGAMMRALPELCRLRPDAHMVICGGDGVSYGAAAPGGRTWRETLLTECPVDPARVHFVGLLARPGYLRLLQISALHLYLTVPFVLSWSCLEAMAAGCLVLGSDVAPVREVIEDGRNGYLVDIRDPGAIAHRAAELLAARAGLAHIRARARDTVRDRYDLADCLARQSALIRSLA